MNKKTSLLLISLTLTLILFLTAYQMGAENYEAGDPIKQPLNPEEVPHIDDSYGYFTYTLAGE